VVAPGKRTLVRTRDRRAFGSLTVLSTPHGSRVWLDGEPVGTTPLQGLKVPVGAHAIKLQHKDLEYVTWVNVERPGEAKRLAVDLTPGVDSTEVAPFRGEQPPSTAPAPRAAPPPPLPVDRPAPPPRRRFWTWIAAGSAAATGIVALGVGVSVAVDQREYENTEDKDRASELEASIRPRSITTNVMIGLTGALAATAVVLYFLEGRRPAAEQKSAFAPAARTTLLPMLGRETGLVLETRF
jgi:hypothetical protein